MNQWSFCQFLNVNPLCKNINPPIEDFLATVLLSTLLL